MIDYRLVVAALAAVLLTTLVLIGLLLLDGRPSADILELVAVGALTALAGLLPGARPR